MHRNYWRLLLLPLLLLATIHTHAITAADSIDTGGPSVVTEGKDALLTCVVMGPALANDTVIWRHENDGVLSAGMTRVTSDKRISVLHDESPKGKSPAGGDVWVLLIKDTRPADSGAYVCEVNSEPVRSSIHILKVKSVSNLPGGSSSKSPSTSSSTSSSASASTPSGPAPPTPSDHLEIPDADEPALITHNYTDCCVAASVADKCLGYCTVHNILDGTTGVEPDACESDFPRIVRCMADGRNHQPCCAKAGVPDICQDMCMGEYSPYTDLAKTHVSCVKHTVASLKCILQGIRLLPSEPENVVVEPLNERSLQVTWTRPQHLGDTVRTYTINVTALHTFDEDALVNMTANLSVEVSGDLDSAVVNDLQPFTMYTITVTANNEHGSSVPSYRLRALTLETGSGATQTSVAVVPVLPDVRGCCVRNGMTHRTCLDRMCDPKKADFTEIPDLMVCAPWANITFACLANRIDHTPCCRTRGIPAACMSFCSGNVTSITFNLFKCLQYMSEYSSCLLQGYGVLPGAPAGVKAPMIAARFAIVEWQPPRVLPDTVTAYQVFVRRIGADDEFAEIEKERSPVILENLVPHAWYETFAVAVNAHGKSEASARLVFRTRQDTLVGGGSGDADNTPAYNQTGCCRAAGILPQCMRLCTFDLKLSEMTELSQTCQPQVGALAKCAAGGRDHTPCCSRRSVPSQCLSLCRGVVPPPPIDCMSYVGNILQCLEEGTARIPGPIEFLHATAVTNSSIRLEWLENRDTVNASNVETTDYLVQYGKVNNMTMFETVIRSDNELNTTDTDIELDKLEANAIYRILVVARGPHGVSLPSSMLLINTSAAVNASSYPMVGVPSPPHMLAVTEHSATWVTVSWQPPEFAALHDVITYKIYHKGTANDKFELIQTRLLWVRLNNLTPNSQYIVYVVAQTRLGASLPSETLVAWTEPALSAFVDPPTIHPADIVAEGGSMTVLCLALGNPAPTISLYVGGHLVRQDTSRHMVTTIHNVTTDMQHVSCYADNGYGIPMQASKKIYISSAPQIQAAGIKLALPGERVDLQCKVRAQPVPKVIFWRDHEGRVPVILGKDYESTMETSAEDPALAVMTLSILKLTNEMAGDYFCHAENVMGSATSAVSVRVRPVPAAHNVTACCAAQNVSSACMDACSFYVDLDTVKDRAECIPEFNKLMKCAADGSDHRSCCARSDVSRHCLDWCRGEPVLAGDTICVLVHTKAIVDCFQSNRERLPGAPLNVRVEVVSEEEALVTWEPPLKNPHMVEGYRIYWRPVGSDGSVEVLLNTLQGQHRADTKDLKLKLTTAAEVQANVMYELVVKAGNTYGSSVMTTPVQFRLSDALIRSANESSAAGVVCGIFGGLCAVALAIGAVYVYQRRRTLKQANGVAFENPSYLREVNMEHVQISAVTPAGGSNGNGPNGSNGVAGGSSSAEQNGNDWRHERLQSPTALSEPSSTATEVNPSLYEELKLGHDGVGFKRLVS